MRAWIAAACAAFAVATGTAPNAAQAVSVVPASATVLTFDEGAGTIADLSNLFGGEDEMPVWVEAGFLVGRYDPFERLLLTPDLSGDAFLLSTNEIMIILDGGVFGGAPRDRRLTALDLDADTTIGGFSLETCGCAYGPSVLTPDGLPGFQTFVLEPSLYGFVFAFGTEEAFAALFGDVEEVGIASGAFLDSAPPSQWGVNNVSLAAVPEPHAWALMIGGFGLVGFALRRRSAPLVA